MPARRILQLGDPMLRRMSEPVNDLDEARGVLADLEDTLAEFRRTHGFGRGISAIQIGVPLRIIFCQVDGVRHELVNPEWVMRSEETFRLWDDCFSFPGIMVWLERSKHVRLRYQDLGGTWHELDAEGAMSELLQHEMDHLDGVLAVDLELGVNALSTREEWERRGGAPPES
jgi:peptide deformylase